MMDLGADCLVSAAYVLVKFREDRNSLATKQSHGITKDFRDSIEGFDIAMRGECIMGFGLCSLGVAVMYALIVFYRVVLPNDGAHGPESLREVLLVADVGSDRGGKLDNGLEKDDQRNSAGVADSVGDNVGDIADMGAVLFGSFAEPTVAALVMAAKATPRGESQPLGNSFSGLYLLVLIPSSGIIVFMITMFLAVAWFRGWGKTMQGIERTRKYVLVTTTILHTPVGYDFAMTCLPKEELVIGGKVVHTSDCTLSVSSDFGPACSLASSKSTRWTRS